MTDVIDRRNSGCGKAVHLTSVHPVTDNRIRYKECAALARAGWDVVLVAPYDADESAGDLRIRAVPRPRRRFDRWWRTMRQVYRAALAERGTIYHFHDPELLAVGLLLRRRGFPVVYDAHEDVPATIAYKYYIPRWLRRPLAWVVDRVERWAVRRLSAVVAATPAIAARFQGQARDVAVVRNFPMLPSDDGPPVVPSAHRPSAVGYVGAISEQRGVLEMVRAIALVPAELQARLALAGTFWPPTLRDDARALPGWAQVDDLGQLDRAAVDRMLSSIRVGLAVLHPSPNYVVALATKMFEYMSAGIPVVVSDFPLWRSIVEEAGCGLLVNPLDPAAIAGAITELLQNPAKAEQMGARGRAAIVARYNWPREAEQLLALYRRLAPA